MKLNETIYQLRMQAKLSQEEFADLFGVSKQAVQKWETGANKPDLDKLTEMSKRFGVSLDFLVLGSDSRVVEELQSKKTIAPHYETLESEAYLDELSTEYVQCLEEGLDVAQYKDLFDAIARLPRSKEKKKFGDVLFEMTLNAKKRADYAYEEPSDLPSIRALRKAYPIDLQVDEKRLESQLHGAWLGRICGCLLGKAVEGVRTDELIPFLKESQNYPLHRYIYKSDVTEEVQKKYNYRFIWGAHADDLQGCAPTDDDTNYTVLAQTIVEKCGKDFTPSDVANAWLNYQSKNSYFTAERVAYYNFLKGYLPPDSACYKNPYREWIGAQIRADYFGYVNAGNPEAAAEMAFRDASISHVKNGIYGEMFVAAAIAVAACTNDIEKIVAGGLAQIPATSRLYEALTEICVGYKSGRSKERTFEKIHELWDEHTVHGWCHTISNAMIVVASLLYGEGDYAKSICMAVETGFDTDCNAATVGSILGMANSVSSISKYWSEPVCGKLATSVFGVGTVEISDCVKKTLEHWRLMQQA